MDWGERRGRHLVYLGIFGVVGAFVIGFFAVVMVESSGPADVDSGRVVERIERDTTICNGVGRARRCQPSTAFAIVGERADGTLWSLAGRDAYDIVRAGDPVEVTTSTVTNRVVALESDRGSWAVRESGFRILAIAWLILAVLCGAGVEFGRRKRGGVALDGPFRLTDALIVPPAVLLGLSGVWFGMFRGEDFTGWSAASTYGTFIDDPLEFDIRATADGSTVDADGHVEVGRFSRNSALNVVVVPRRDLGEDVASAAEAEQDAVVAVPLIAREGFRPGPVRFLLVEPSELEGIFPDDVKGIEPIDCPDSLVAYPTELGEDDEVLGGFICFEPASVGTATLLRITAGSGVGIERKIHQLER